MTQHAIAEPDRIRVLHLGSPTGLYGAERWILALIKNLPIERIRSWVGVIRDAPGLEAPLCREASRLGVGTRVFEAPGKLSLKAIGQIRDFIRENRIQILHTHGYKPDIIGRVAVKGTDCRTLATPHGWSTNAGHRLRAYEAIDRVCFMFLDAIAPLSEELHAGLRVLPGMRSKLHMIENGVDMSEFETPCEVPEPLRSWRTAGLTLIGYVGQLIERKRLDTLITAFHQVSQPDAHLCLIGDGPSRPHLEELVLKLGESTRVTFLGYRYDRIALIKGLDIFVLPSELEGIPRCLMEAMSAAVPVIASDIPGCRELVQPDVTGLLFAPGDPNALCRQIDALLGDADTRERLAQTGAEHVRTRYSAARMAQEYLALYEHLVVPARTRSATALT